MTRRHNDFHAIRSEGGLLPPDLLRRVLDPKERLAGVRPEDYGLPQGERLNEVITQSWNRLRRHWAEFLASAANLPKGEPATGLTNDKWSLPLLRELGFGLLPTTAGPEIDGRTYAINRFFGPVPIHLVGCGLSLDRRAAGVRGAAAVNPHGLVQEFLNRSEGHLWAIVSNGLRFRLLRDNQALSRQSFLEFDLEAMLAGEVYSDFVLLWLMAHATRFVSQENERPESCWLEHWTKIAGEQGTRALGDLRGGVEKALQILGEGFTSHPKNTTLRDALRTGQVSLIDFHGQLLRVVYRLIFLFVAEDRTLDGQPLLHPGDPSEAARLARERYAAHYSTGRLRDMASRIKGSRHGDLWRQFQLLVNALSGTDQFDAARQLLALPALGSFLWDPDSTAALNDAELTNHDLLEALRHLAFTRQGKMLRPVDYKNLGAEELGGVYESLLALTPQISADGARFSFAEFAGNERKTSGSYYTPDSLVQCLLDSALDPVVAKAIKGKTGVEAEKAILNLKVCDPAVGSGHFLVGAAHRLARHLARVRALAQGESEPSPLLYQHALRDVIGRCLYGVDVNPMSAELCRVNLWLEALEPGKPLSFLDHHIRVGNSLLGAIPELVAAGLPDDAFKPFEGDDKQACAELKKRNKGERKGWGPIEGQRDAETQARLAQAAATLEELPDDRPESIRAKELAFHRHEETEAYRKKKLLADAWCAAFVIKKYFPPHPTDPRFPSSEPYGITQGLLNGLASGMPLPAGMAEEIEDLARQYQFFHWHLTFPEVFAKGGFDCMLGNPPWDMQEVKDNEFFASCYPEILSVKSAKDKAAVLYKIQSDDAELWQEYQEYVRFTYGQKHLMAASGRFPYANVGRLNLYRLFLELEHNFMGPTGRVGIVVPSGFASDSFSQDHFATLHGDNRLVSLYDFENRLGLFPGVDSRYRFCLLTIGGKGVCSDTDFFFFAHSPSDLADTNRHIRLSQQAVSVLNPLSRTAPLFRTRHDYILTLMLQKAGPIIGRDEGGQGWRIKPTLMFMMNAAMKGHRTAEELYAKGFHLRGNCFTRDSDVWFPFYEGKMVGMYDHRAAIIRFDPTNRVRRNQPVALSDTEHQDPKQLAQPMFWVSASDVSERCNVVPRWCLAIKDVTASTNERTAIASMLAGVALTHSLPWLPTPHTAELNACLLANFNSFCFDYTARQKVAGLHLYGHYLNQLPVIGIPIFNGSCRWSEVINCFALWISPRVLELTYTAWDLEPFAQDCGWSASPFRWDEERRFILRCELDAAFFHLYLQATANGQWGITNGEVDAEGKSLAIRHSLLAAFPTPRHAVNYIMDTFPIVRRKDEAKYDGDYRTKRVILEIYDAMQEAIRTGQPYQTLLDPPPGPPIDAEGNFIQPADWTEVIRERYRGIIHPPREEAE
ncbi:MAG: N-6 DNA methylase [Proteobacteria bacterium]|nr:N-6 DNA methylase [Pseudomonadota bacterium]